MRRSRSRERAPAEVAAVAARKHSTKPNDRRAKCVRRQWPLDSIGVVSPCRAHLYLRFPGARRLLVEVRDLHVWGDENGVLHFIFSFNATEIILFLGSRKFESKVTAKKFGYDGWGPSTRRRNCPFVSRGSGIDTRHLHILWLPPRRGQGEVRAMLERGWGSGGGGGGNCGRVRGGRRVGCLRTCRSTARGPRPRAGRGG